MMKVEDDGGAEEGEEGQVGTEFISCIALQDVGAFLRGCSSSSLIAERGADDRAK